MFFVYIIHSKNFNKYYIGSSRNPWRRIEKHNTSTFNTFTSKYRPWEIKAVFEAGTSRGQAEEIEKFIKMQKSKTLLIKLIDQNFIPNGKLAQLVIPYIRDARAGLIRGYWQRRPELFGIRAQEGFKLKGGSPVGFRYSNFSSFRIYKLLLTELF